MAGTAHVISEGFDTDTMTRHVVFAFDPPWYGQSVKRVVFSGITSDGLPTPMSDDMIQGFYKRYTHRIGYKLV